MDLSVRPTVVVEVVGIVVRVDPEGLVGRQFVQIEQLAGEARRTLVKTINIGNELSLTLSIGVGKDGADYQTDYDEYIVNGAFYSNC